MSLLMDALKKAEQAKKKASRNDGVVDVGQNTPSSSNEALLPPEINVVPPDALAEEGIAGPLSPDVNNLTQTPLKSVTKVQSAPAVEDDLTNLEALTLVDLSEVDEEQEVTFQEDKIEKAQALADEPEVPDEAAGLTLEGEDESEGKSKSEPNITKESDRPDSKVDAAGSVTESGDANTDNNHDGAATLSETPVSVAPVSVDTPLEQESTSPDSVVINATKEVPEREQSSAHKAEPPPLESVAVEAPSLVSAPSVAEAPKLNTPPIVGIGANKASRRRYLWSSLIAFLLLLLGGMIFYFNMALETVSQRAEILPVALPVEVQEIEQVKFENATQLATVETETVRVPAEVKAKPVVTTRVETSLPIAAIATEPKKKPAPVKQLASVRQPESRANSAPTAIQITRAERPDPLEKILQEAYQAYQSGLYPLAEDKYRLALKRDADNRDARLGLAVIAQRTGMVESARRLYQSLLVLNPRDSIAITGLMSLPGNSGSKQNESHIKLMLDEEPTAAHLHFSLGVEYVVQERWAEAQQSFFQAYRSAPDNADYSYNLAVSLEQLSQSNAALDYYRRARQLASGQQVGFGIEQLDQRIARLSVSGEQR